MRPGQMNRNRNKSERIFQSICHWCEREDSMEIDAGGAGLRREAMEATPQRAHKARAPDRELNQLYLDIRKQYRDDPVFLNALRRAQRACIRFRETQIKMKYPEAPDAYGSSFSMCRNGYLEALTRARTATLKEWQSGAEEGDVCAGSIRHQAAENAGEEKAKSR